MPLDDKPTLDAPVIFISDAHIGGFTEKENIRIENEFIQLIDYCQEHCIKIALLGDLFDYWMEYPAYVPPLGKQVLDRFEEFNRETGPSLYITGNHDNWTNNHLEKRGFYIEHEYFTCSMNNRTFMLLHGDGLADSSLGLSRPYTHKFLRNKLFIKLYQAILPPKWGVGIMKYFSRFSRILHSSKEEARKLNNWAYQQLTDSDIDVIMSGHDHIPRRKHYSFGTYINLGTFYKHRTMAYYNNDTLTLVSWEPSKKALQPFEHNINE